MRRAGVKTKTKLSNEEFVYRALCILAGVIALLPVSCGYIMDGGSISEWIGRIEELAAGLGTGRPYLFPQADAFAGSGVRGNAMNSNFWFFIPGFLYALSGNMVLAYRFYMLAIQAGTLSASLLLFGRAFRHSDTKLPVLMGTLLYMTCPYRIYVCYGLADLSQAAAWMLLPLYIWAIWELADGGGRMGALAAACAALAGIGYADTVFFVAAAGATLLTALASGKFRCCWAVAAGGILFAPGLYRLARYLFTDGYGEWELPLGSIMHNGYSVGEYFNTYAFRNERPGMGLGMLLCLLTGLWLIWVGGSRAVPGSGRPGKDGGAYRFFGVMAGLFMLLSLRYFPWDLFQRLGLWSLKLVSLIGEPAIFWGMAYLCLCIPASHALERLGGQEDEPAASAVPLLVLLACIAVCVYQCNTLTYSRLPLELAP